MNKTADSGIKLATRIVTLAESRPIAAVALALIFLVALNSGISWGISFFGQRSAISVELAKLHQKDRYLESAINAERDARIEEQVRLVNDGKLLSDSDIIVEIRKQLDEWERRLIARNLLK